MPIKKKHVTSIMSIRLLSRDSFLYLGHIIKDMLEDGSTKCMICEYLVGVLIYQLESNVTKV